MRKAIVVFLSEGAFGLKGKFIREIMSIKALNGMTK